MNSLDIARQGKSAARQIRAQMTAGVLTQPELDRLMRKVEAGYEQMMPAPLPVLDVTPMSRPGAFSVARS